MKIKIDRHIVLHVISYGCETWSVTLREEHRLRVFESIVLRETSGVKLDGVTGEWRKLHNEELYERYCSRNIFQVIKSRIISWARHVARMGDRRSA